MKRMDMKEFSGIVGGPGNPTVNAFAESTTDKRKFEPFIIGCDLAQGESMTGRIEY